MAVIEKTAETTTTMVYSTEAGLIAPQRRLRRVNVEF